MEAYFSRVKIQMNFEFIEIFRIYLQIIQVEISAEWSQKYLNRSVRKLPAEKI